MENLTRFYKSFTRMVALLGSKEMPRPKKYLSENPKPIKVGSTRFKPITSREMRLVEKNKKFWICEREWAIDYGKFDRFEWKMTFEIMEQTCIENLWLNDNKSVVVLRSLSPCTFTNLLILNLNANQIQSLEAICLLQAPLLERIEFSDNQLTDIKSLRKTSFQNLSWLSFCNNPVTDWSVLAEVFAPKLSKLDFRRKPFPILDENVSWLLKMQSKMMMKVDALSFRRIPQQDVKAMIRERYNHILLEWSVI